MNTVEKPGFKEKLFSKRGSVLFIVLVIMSFMLVLASAVYYAVQNGRKSVVMDYSDSQAYQTANDVLAAMDAFFLQYQPDPSSGIGDLNTAIANLHVHCPTNFPLCDQTATNAKACPGVYPPKMGTKCAVAIWTSNPDLTRDELMAKSPDGLEEGIHYIRTTSPSTIPGTGDISVLIYVNAQGDIVLEVTVEYNGRKVTTSRFYDLGDQRAFIPRWADPSTKEGGGLHWEWVSKDYPWPGQKDTTGRWGTSPYQNLVISGHFLYGDGKDFTVSPPKEKLKCWIYDDAVDGWAVRKLPGTLCRDKRCENMFPGGCPEASDGGCFFKSVLSDSDTFFPNVAELNATAGETFNDKNGENGKYSATYGDETVNTPAEKDKVALRANWIGGCHDVSWDCCYMGKGWWVWVADGTPPSNNTARPVFGDPNWPATGDPYVLNYPTYPTTPSTNHQITAPWYGVIFGKETSTAGTYANLTCSDSLFKGSACQCNTGNQWRIGRVWGWMIGATPPIITTTEEIELPNCAGYDVVVKYNDTEPGNCEIVARGLAVDGSRDFPNLYSATIGSSSFPNGSLLKLTDGTPYGAILPNGTPFSDTAYKKDGTTLFDDSTLPNGSIFLARCEVCQFCVPGTTSNPTDPTERGPDGTFTFGVPGLNFSWKQRAAYHSTGTGGDLDHLAIRGVNATVHFDTEWAVLNKTSTRGAFRSDISANNNLVFGDAIIENPAGVVREDGKPMEVTVGKDLWVGNPGNSGVTTIQGDNGQVTGGPIVIRVGGDFYTYAQNSSNYGNSNTAYYILGDMYLRNGPGNWPSGGATVYLYGKLYNKSGAEITNLPSNIIKMTEQQKTETETVIDWYLGDVDTTLQWPLPTAYDRTLSVRWGANNGDDWPADGSNPLGKYDVLVNGTIKERIFYIDGTDSTNGKNNIKVSTANTSGASQQHTSMVIIDTGLDPDNVVTLQLQGNGGVFNWKGSTSDTQYVAVLTIGNGTTVFELPDDGTVYQAGGGGLFVGPFNMAVIADTSSSVNWVNCSRLRNLSEAKSNITGCDPFHCSTAPGVAPTNVCRTTDGNKNNWNSWGCWMNGLLRTDGSGALRSNLVETEDVIARNHTPPLNMNTYLVYNGSGHDKIQLGQWSLFVGSVYCPNMIFYTNNSSTNTVTHFGSIFASELRLLTQNFFIAALPGGGLSDPNVTTRPKIEFETNEPQDPTTPDGGDPNTQGGDSGNDLFDLLDPSGSGNRPGRR